MAKSSDFSLLTVLGSYRANVMLLIPNIMLLNSRSLRNKVDALCPNQTNSGIICVIVIICWVAYRWCT